MPYIQRDSGSPGYIPFIIGNRETYDRLKENGELLDVVPPGEQRDFGHERKFVICISDGYDYNTETTYETIKSDYSTHALPLYAPPDEPRLLQALILDFHDPVFLAHPSQPAEASAPV